MKEETKVSWIKIALLIALTAAIVLVAVFAFPRPAMAPEPEPTATPVPEPEPMMTESEPSPTVRAAFIPDPDEMQAIPAVTELTLKEDYITFRYEDEDLIVTWPEQKDSDYSVLCVLDSEGAILQKDVLWAEITEWEFPDFEGTSVLLLCYKDMGEDSAKDDKIVGTYILNIVPTEPEPTQGPTKKPAPTKKINKYYIIVDKADHTFSVFTHDDNGEYTKKVISFPCAIGKSSSSTPTGKFKISSKGPWKRWGSGHYSPYYVRYTSGLFFHGPTYNKKDRSTMIKKSYEEIGKNASGGCIRTTIAGAYWVYKNCPQGTVVEIVKSSGKVDKVTKPAIDPDFPTWDPTDPKKPKTSETSSPPSASPSASPSESPSASPSQSPADPEGDE